MKPRQKQTLLTWAGEDGAMEKEALNLSPSSSSSLFSFHGWQRKLKYLAQSVSGVARIQPWACLKPNPCLSLQSRMQSTWLFSVFTLPHPSHSTASTGPYAFTFSSLYKACQILGRDGRFNFPRVPAARWRRVEGAGGRGTETSSRVPDIPPASVANLDDKDDLDPQNQRYKSV